MVEKLVLGTANFGMKYGIAFGNQIPEEEIYGILNLAWQEGVWGLDTAPAYGMAEELIGRYIRQTGRRFRLITKLPKKEYRNYADIKNTLLDSLRSLRVERVQYLLLHSFESFMNQRELFSESLQRLRDEGLAEVFGVSVYHPHEVLEFMKIFRKGFAVEFPMNVFDQRFVPYLEIWNSEGIKLFARSVFLQGLFFLPEERLTGRFERVKGKVFRLRALSEELGLGYTCLLLAFILRHATFLEGFVVGVDSLSHLEELTECLKNLPAIEPDWKSFEVEDEDIILPYRWR